METHEITLPSPADLPRGVKVVSVLVYVGVIVATLAAFRAFEPHPPHVVAQVLLGALWGIPAALIVLALGFVYADARLRGMNAAMWTILVALLIPGAIGFVLYLFYRKPLQAGCPQCRAEVRETANYCPQCGGVLRATCPGCRLPRRVGDRFCPSCGTSLD